MARTTIDRERLTKYVQAGLTQEQMTEAFYADTGEWRTRASFASAMRRYGVLALPERRKPRYTETVPWRVKLPHINTYTARMLRALGRRERGLELPDDEADKLDVWLRGLDADEAVIHYDPETPEGFWRVPREARDGDGYVRIT